MNREGEKTSKFGLVAAKVLAGLLEKLWIQPDVSLAHYVFTPEFATWCFGGADVALMFCGPRGCLAPWVGTS